MSISGFGDAPIHLMLKGSKRIRTSIRLFWRSVNDYVIEAGCFRERTETSLVSTTTILGMLQAMDQSVLTTNNNLIYYNDPDKIP